MATLFHPEFEKLILAVTGAPKLEMTELLQELWSGYGKIVRVNFNHSAYPSIVVKHINHPLETDHPRGWNTNRSHLRKVRSYQVETAWYCDWSQKCDEDCQVPRLLAYQQINEETLLVLEDLDAAGFSARNLLEIQGCLRWLAHFHATFLGVKPTGLWETGTYWHLATRPDEWAALPEGSLKNAAGKIDAKLKDATYQTLVHGDAKLANFCFSPSGDRVAAVDFQYVGAGCGMKDVAYFIGSCLRESECESRVEELLDSYFEELSLALLAKQPDIAPESVVTEWRALFPLAWTDFHRFLKGWSPGHWKLNSFSERTAREVLDDLDKS